jgi:hypothetical protein
MTMDSRLTLVPGYTIALRVEPAAPAKKAVKKSKKAST